MRKILLIILLISSFSISSAHSSDLLKVQKMFEKGHITNSECLKLKREIFPRTPDNSCENIAKNKGINLESSFANLKFLIYSLILVILYFVLKKYKISLLKIKNIIFVRLNDFKKLKFFKNTKNFSRNNSSQINVSSFYKYGFIILVGIFVVNLTGFDFNFFGKSYKDVDPNTLSAEERRSYNCVEVFGFRKGSSKYKDCVFKIYQTELQLKELEQQKLIAEKEIAIAEANARSAQASADRQAAAAQRQAAAAMAQANAADMQNSLQLMQQGLQMLNPPQPQSFKTTCTNLGTFINCW